VSGILSIDRRLCYIQSVMRKFPFFLVLLSVFLGGCLQESPEELERLTKEDPVFKQMILARNQAHQQIQLIREDLLFRKKQLDVQMERLRADYDAVAKAQNAKIGQMRASIETNRESIKKDIEASSASLLEKSAELEGYQRTLSDVRKVLNESKGISLSKTERQKWEERILMLSEKMRPLSEEIQELRIRIRLKKQKIQFLN
jgi:hypothetical protein